METKERVFRTSRKLGYRASKIKGVHHLCFAVLYGQSLPEETLSMDPDVSIWEGVSRRAVEQDITLYTQNFLPKRESIQFADLPRWIRRDQCDGLVLLGTFYESLGVFLREAKIPFVLAGNAETRFPVDQVRIDVEQGVYGLISELVRRGHRRFGFITMGADLAVNRQFLRAFRGALEEHRLFDPKLVVTTDDPEPDGIQMATSLLKRKKPPTLIFATTRRMANEAVFAAARLGFEFDSGLEIATPHNDQYLRLGYPLHLVRSDLIGVGERAFDRLMQVVQNPNQNTVSLTVACPPLIRPSRKSPE